jgi:hypothetical protein
MALSHALGQVGLGSRVSPVPADHDDVQGAVCSPIASRLARRYDPSSMTKVESMIACVLCWLEVAAAVV